MIKLRNFTPHEVNLYVGDKVVAVWPSEGEIRLAESEKLGSD